MISKGTLHPHTCHSGGPLWTPVPFPKRSLRVGGRRAYPCWAGTPPRATSRCPHVLCHWTGQVLAGTGLPPPDPPPCGRWPAGWAEAPASALPPLGADAACLSRLPGLPGGWAAPCARATAWSPRQPSGVPLSGHVCRDLETRRCFSGLGLFVDLLGAHGGPLVVYSWNSRLRGD